MSSLVSLGFSSDWLLTGAGAMLLRAHEVEAHIDAYKSIIGDKGASSRIHARVVETGVLLREVNEETSDLLKKLDDPKNIGPYLTEHLKTAIFRAKIAERTIDDISISGDPTESGEYVRVPRYEVAASAGGGAFIESEQIVDYLTFRAEWVRNALGVALNQLALINVIGDSMEPSLSEGDVVLLDLSQAGVRDSSIYVIQLDGALLVKRIQRKLDGSMTVSSDNPRYTPETVTGEAMALLKIIGRVVWVGRRL